MRHFGAVSWAATCIVWLALSGCSANTATRDDNVVRFVPDKRAVPVRPPVVQPRPVAVAPTTDEPTAQVAMHEVLGEEEDLHSRPLLAAYPALREKLPMVALAEFPTPITKYDRLGAELGIGALYFKRDDLAGDPYGGSKVRKMEFLFGEAKQAGNSTVIAMGGVGSNTTMATALHAPRVGLSALLLLAPHPVDDEVRYKLRAMHKLGGAMRACPHLEGCFQVAGRLIREAGGRRRYYAMGPGATSPLGNVGFVNAAFELKEQIDRGLMPVPDTIYMAAGTMGSAAGLIVGLRAVGLRTRVVAVKTTFWVTDARLRGQILLTARYLRSIDESFPLVGFGFNDHSIEHGQYGFAHAHPTKEATLAIELVREHAGIQLDRTYTGKAFAALIDDAPKLSRKVVLFWNSYDPRRIPVGDVAASDLPPKLQRYLGTNTPP